MTSVCIDSSLIIAMLADEPLGGRARAKLSQWARDHTALVVPSFFPYEIVSVIRRKTHFREKPDAWGKEALRIFSLLTYTQEPFQELGSAAYTLAKHYHLPTIYDCCYLAIALKRKITFWTLDKSFARAVKDQPCVNLMR